VEQGRVVGPEAIGAEIPRVVPVVERRPATVRTLDPRASQEFHARPDPDSGVVILPAQG
jgi:hypothetical protein